MACVELVLRSMHSQRWRGGAGRGRSAGWDGGGASGSACVVRCATRGQACWEVVLVKRSHIQVDVNIVIGRMVSMVSGAF